MAEEYLTDDEQLDAVKRWTVEYAPVLIIGAVLGLAGIFGYRYYDSYRNEKALKAAAQFGLMTVALDGGDHKKSRDLADGIIKDFPGSPYADQAQLALARISVDDGLDAGAIAPLTAVMNGSKDAELKQIARLRLARVLIDQGKPDDAIKLLSEGTPGVFAGRFHEVHGDALYAKKDVPGAVAEYKAAQSSGAAGGIDGPLLELKLADLGSAKAKP